MHGFSEPVPPRHATPEDGAGKRYNPAASSAQVRHHELRFLTALKLLIESGRAGTIADMIRYAEQDKQVEAVGFLRTLVDDQLPVDLAYDALCVHARIVAHKRNTSLLAGCQGLRVGLVLPLPHHVMDAFSSLTGVTLLIPDGHHLPPHLRQTMLPCRHSTRDARAALAELDVLVFEVFTAGDVHYVDAKTADVVDLRVVPSATRLVVHRRPHRHPDDVELPNTSRPLSIL